MITFSMLGKYGRLGNQLFQLGCIDSLSKKLNTKYFLNKSYCELNDLKFFNLNNLNNCIWVENEEYNFLYEKNIKFSYKEPKFSFSEDFFNLPDCVDIFGYFQSYKYLNSEFCNIFNKNINIENNICFIHVRRGDYLNLENYHYNLSKSNYYELSQNYLLSINPNIKFLYFSDDFKFCKEKFGNNIEIFDSNPSISLQKMIECDYSIMANSSFSWWGSFLNKKVVISPKSWFGNSGPKDINDLYKPEWILI